MANEGIDDAYRIMFEHEAETFAVLTIDYKMKYEPKKYREKSYDFYGRRGISWHGTVVTYVPKPTETELTRSEGHGQTPRSDGQGGKRPKDIQIKHLYYDHICRNTSKQDAYAVLALIELVCRRIKKDKPTIETVVFRSDNAGNYRNKLVPVAAPFIFGKYGIVLHSIVHNEPCNGKGPAYIHFAIAMKFIDAYISTLEMDVVTAADLVLGLNSGIGMSGAAAELYDLNDNNSNMREWKRVNGLPESKGGLPNLGQYSIVRYTHDVNKPAHVNARTYAYSYSKPIQWNMEIFSCTCEHEQAEVATTAVEGECVEGEEERECVEGEEEGAEGEVEDLDMNEESEEIGYSDMEQDGLILFNGPMKGVTIVSTGDVRRTSGSSCKMSARLRQARRPLTSNMLCDLDDDKVTGDEFNLSDLESITHIRYRTHGNCFLCRKCGHSFDTESTVIQHWMACGVHAMSTTVVDRAIRFLNCLIDKHQITVVRRPQDNPFLKKVVVSEDVRATVLFGPYWARRPKKGFTLGRNFIESFKADVKEMVQRGVRDKSKNMSCSKMQEQIRNMYPNRYDIPNVHNINSYVQSLLKAIREEGTGEVPEGAGVTTKYKMPEVYANALDRIVRETPTIMPASGRRKLLEALNIDGAQLPAGLPTDKQVRSKVSALKSKMKKQLGG